MNSQKKLKTEKSNPNSPGNTNNFARKPRQSIKQEGNALNSMLKEGQAKVIDASKLGKRLSSDIWTCFGAIQVDDNFTNPTIATKTVADGASTLKICQFFVACSKCFSVFKYDGHAYGTTGLVKHVKICTGTNQRLSSTTSGGPHGFNTPNATLDHTTIDTTHTSPSVPNNSTSLMNGPTPARRRRTTTTTTGNATLGSNRAGTSSQSPSFRYLAKVIEELRNEQIEMKQKLYEMINLMSNSEQVNMIAHDCIITNDGGKVEDELQKAD